MADSEVLKKLKDIPFRIQTASLKERRSVVEEIQDVLSNPDITEPAVRFVCRVLTLTLHRYRDSTSQYYVKRLLLYLVTNHRECTIRNLLPLLLDISETLRNTATSKNTSQSGLYVLRWTTILCESSIKSSEVDIDYNMLVMSQANLLAVITASGDKKRHEKGYSVVHNLWKAIGKDNVKKWLDVLLNQPSDGGAHLCVAYSVLCRHYKDIGEDNIISAHKTKMLETFIKSLISVKTRPNSNYVKGCSDLLHMLTKSEVQDILLPALHKAMLRSPETIIQAVGEVVTNLNVDLEGPIVEIGKILIVNLHSKDEWARSEALTALEHVSRGVKSLQAARALVTHAFAEYNGASGKLTSSEDKIAVLNGVGVLSVVALDESVGLEAGQELSASACQQLGRALDGESHERTLLGALRCLARWAAAHPAAAPAHLMPPLMKGLSAKSTSQSVRTAFTCVLVEALQDEAARTQLTQTARDQLWAAFSVAADRALQNPQQVAVVCEGVAGALGMLLVEAARAQQSPVWAALVLPSKQPLLHDRVLAAAADYVLEQVVFLCTHVLESSPSVADDGESPLHRALLQTMLSPQRSVRACALRRARRLLAHERRGPLAVLLMHNLNRLLDDNRHLIEKPPSDDKPTDLTGKMILDCVHALCSFRDYPRDVLEQLALEALPGCHAGAGSGPGVGVGAGPGVGAGSRAWGRLVRALRLDARRMVAAHVDALTTTYLNEYHPAPTTSAVVCTLMSLCEVFAERGVQRVQELLQHEDLLAVSRDEYFTYLTPPTELYDKSQLPGNEDNSEMNLKRESKAYSYKEQLEELQLRRELLEKRKKEGKLKEVPLTAKQKEAMKAQFAKEAAIRERLTELDARVRAGVRLAACAWAGGGGAAAGAVAPLLGCLRGPLGAPAAARALLAAHAHLPRRPRLPASLPLTMLRLHKPQCDLEPSSEPLEVSTAREINRLHAATLAPAAAGAAGAAGARHTLDSLAFHYVFPLLERGLSGAGGKLDEATTLNALAIISTHAEALADQPLPIEPMFRLLIQIIGTSTGRIQTMSTAALLEVGRSAARTELALPDLQCLLAALQAPAEVVRDAALRAVWCVRGRLGELVARAHHHHNLTLTRRLYVATFDVAPDNQKLAKELWDSVPELKNWWEHIEEEECLEALLEEVQQPAEALQRAAAAAAAARVAANSQSAAAADRMLQRLQDAYTQKLPLTPAKLDQFGHVVVEAVDAWEARRGTGEGLVALAGLLRPAAVPAAMAFLVDLALADRAEPVRAAMLAAAMAIVDLHGKETLSSQLPVFEKFLDRAPKSGGYDAVRESVVLLMGSLARHLEPHDARIRPITLRLVASLSTPSQQVQEAVSNCLPHLVSSPALEEDIPVIVNKLMKQLLTADKYGDRKGAAYGIAGIVKGLGILSLKQLDVMGKLIEAIQEKKNYKYREGALFGFEMLCHKLGRLFEPYIVHVLPHLLLCFGDSSQYVRAAADDAAKLIMSRLSAHGVKLVLPALLHALHDDNWRTKAGSIELLGAMAYCAPKQLSSCLPSIVPKLIEVLSDSHERVQRAAGEALRVIGSVIRNPEIQAIVGVLLQALQEPGKSTAPCLATLLDTKFVHFIDAPSLALIMPVVQRAFLDRSTETRKMAAQIIGNMYSLTDQKDLTPYLPHIMPGLKSSLLDPVPEVRAVSARALGAMVRGLGEASFDELLPWLMHTLTCEASSVDRSGAAQGLAEVVAGLGVHKLHKIMPEIIATAERTDIAPHVKDGYIMMFIYMPGAFTGEFTPYISQIINPILKALADENEYVRETALKAGQRIVTLYAESAIALLLPELERGLFDDNWRIRYSSVQLLGDLLYRISGVSGKMSTETASDDDNFGTEQSHGAIITALGVERRNRVLAGLYMGRSDVALMVRQAALHVWKVVVTNTPKTLREILPTLFSLLLGCLASTNYDKRQVAARTLGDLVRKLGERVVPEIVPILEEGLLSDRADQRQGVCVGLGEIVASTSRDAVLGFAERLVPTLRTALTDPLPAVRAAAARTFDALHAAVGARALDDVLPPLLRALHDEDPARADYALDGLKQIMAVKSRAVLPYLVPVVCAGGDTRALSALAAAAGPALARHLPRVLPALLAALAAEPAQPAGLQHCRDALLPVAEPAAVRCIVDALLEAARAPEPARRRAAAALLCAYVSHTRADLAPHVAPLLRGLLALLAGPDPDSLQLAWEALFALTKSLQPDQLLHHVPDVRHALKQIAADLPPHALLPGFCLPKGIAPILPLFREAILNGLPEDKENAALMLGEVIRLTSAAAIQPCVVHITGPLIRILGDRFNASVKAAVLDTLAALLAKVGVMLKQFLPQLQTTFLKALHDGHRGVRLRAGHALAQLVGIHSRADPLFAELAAAVRAPGDARDTHLHALRGLLVAGGDKLSEPLALALLGTLAAPAPEPAAAGCLGALLAALPPPHRAAAVLHHVLAPAADDAAALYRATALLVALKENPDAIYNDQFEEKIDKTLLSYLSSDRVGVVMAGVRGSAYLLRYLLRVNKTVPPALLTTFTRSMNHQNNEVKQLCARALGVVGREAEPGAGADVLRAVLPALVNGTKEKSTIVRANAELALRSVASEGAAALLEPGARAALLDVLARLGRRAAPRDLDLAADDLDPTLLT